MLVLLVLAILTLANGQRTLESYNVDMSHISTSGFSSGGAMAVQYHVAYSSEIRGAASFAGASPPMCWLTGFPNCANNPNGISILDLWEMTSTQEVLGNIDASTNMQNDKVFLFFGSGDGLVNPDGALANENYYEGYMPSANIFRYDTMNCEHGIPTWSRGVNCPTRDGIIGGIYVNDCSYDGPYEALEWIHGGLERPVYIGELGPTLAGDWYEYEQWEFLDDPLHPGNDGWDPRGWIYVPSGCMDKQTPCKLHIMYHGCGMGRYYIGDNFASYVGFNEVGELNNIIIVYPQVRPSDGSTNGCWDWFGYTGNDVAYKTGKQMLASKRTMDRITGLNPVKQK